MFPCVHDDLSIDLHLASGSRPSSRAASRSGSSQPPSRTASDMSSGSIEGYKLGPRKKSNLSQQNGSTHFTRTSSFTKSSSPIGPRWK